jgi:GTP cyclohydrolase IA
MPEVINPLTPHHFQHGYRDPGLCAACFHLRGDPLHRRTETASLVAEKPSPENRRLMIEEGVRCILTGLGVDPKDHNFNETPRRVAEVYAELFTPPETGWPVFDEEYTDIVILRHHIFWTLCPHHMLPVQLDASVAYMPNGKVIGASKLARLIHEVNRQPFTQERLTDLICQAISKYTGGTAKGEAVMLCGSHDCFKIRGIKSSASMITYRFEGEFKKDVEHQRRFIELCRV